MAELFQRYEKFCYWVWLVLFVVYRGMHVTMKYMMGLATVDNYYNEFLVMVTVTLIAYNLCVQSETAATWLFYTMCVGFAFRLVCALRYFLVGFRQPLHDFVALAKNNGTDPGLLDSVVHFQLNSIFDDFHLHMFIIFGYMLGIGFIADYRLRLWSLKKTSTTKCGGGYTRMINEPLAPCDKQAPAGSIIV